MAHLGFRTGLHIGCACALALAGCSFEGDESLGNNSAAGAAGTDSGGTAPAGGRPAQGGGGATAGSPGQTPCGGWLGDTCSADEYCAYEGGDCGYADGSAVCKPRPESCPTIDEPVCGCDGVTHSNSCEAAMSGTGYLRAGACEGGASCSVGGVTYPDGASDIPAVDGCNTCICAGGSLACTDMACPSTPCGGELGDTCGGDEYCAYEGGDCGYADGTALCRQRPTACDAILDPVCGCDGVTYSSACAAAMAGTGTLRAGACDAALVNCDQRGVLCRVATPTCPALQVPSVNGDCYGPCVPIDQCACTEAAECADTSQFTCWISSGHCGPYVI